MQTNIISRVKPQYLCRSGRGAELDALGEVELNLNYSPEKLLLEVTQYAVGFCHFFTADGGLCKNPYSKNSNKVACPFPSRGLPMFNNQNEASEALMERYYELQKIANQPPSSA